VGLVSLLFSFQGRINRTQFWLGSIGVGVVGTIAILGIMFSAGASAMSAPSKDLALQAFASVGFLLLPLLMVLSWMGYALQVKRFHDRGRSGLLTLLPFAVAMLAMFTAFTTILGGATAQEFEAALQPYVLVSWLINIAFLIDLGFLPSKEGPNKYGDPPGSTPSSAPYRPAPTATLLDLPPPAAPASPLLSAQSAIDRAIAEKAAAQAASKLHKPAAQPRPAPTPPRTPASAGGAPSFGRRAAR